MLFTLLLTSAFADCLSPSPARIEYALEAGGAKIEVLAAGRCEGEDVRISTEVTVRAAEQPITVTRWTPGTSHRNDDEGAGGLSGNSSRRSERIAAHDSTVVQAEHKARPEGLTEMHQRTSILNGSLPETHVSVHSVVNAETDPPTLTAHVFVSRPPRSQAAAARACAGNDILIGATPQSHVVTCLDVPNDYAISGEVDVASEGGVIACPEDTYLQQIGQQSGRCIGLTRRPGIWQDLWGHSTWEAVRWKNSHSGQGGDFAEAPVCHNRYAAIRWDPDDTDDPVRCAAADMELRREMYPVRASEWAEKP
ncbi:MAG: hypothetical protein KC912_09520 [Proteobacteria bacterium]|nr:hypothetical protein [Pseudomonadota bacterium]